MRLEGAVFVFVWIDVKIEIAYFVNVNWLRQNVLLVGNRVLQNDRRWFG